MRVLHDGVGVGREGGGGDAACSAAGTAAFRSEWGLSSDAALRDDVGVGREGGWRRDAACSAAGTAAFRSEWGLSSDAALRDGVGVGREGGGGDELACVGRRGTPASAPAEHAPSRRGWGAAAKQAENVRLWRSWNRRSGCRGRRRVPPCRGTARRRSASAERRQD
jgi:hypothetical protein